MDSFVEKQAMGGFAKRVSAGIIAHTTTRPGMVAFLGPGKLVGNVDAYGEREAYGDRLADQCP